MYTYKKQDRNITNCYGRIINVEKNGLKEIQKAFGKTLGLQTLLFSRDKLLLLKKEKIWKVYREAQNAVQWIFEPLNSWFWVITWLISLIHLWDVYHPIWGWELNRWSSGHCAHLKQSSQSSRSFLWKLSLLCHMTLSFPQSTSLPLETKMESVFSNYFCICELNPRIHQILRMEFRKTTNPWCLHWME